MTKTLVDGQRDQQWVAAYNPEGSYALVIGVSNYQDNAWVDLDSVGADVKAVRERRVFSSCSVIRNLH